MKLHGDFHWLVMLVHLWIIALKLPQSSVVVRGIQAQYDVCKAQLKLKPTCVQGGVDFEQVRVNQRFALTKVMQSWKQLTIWIDSILSDSNRRAIPIEVIRQRSLNQFRLACLEHAHRSSV
jgi:hypothetical protein